MEGASMLDGPFDLRYLATVREVAAPVMWRPRYQPEPDLLEAGLQTLRPPMVELPGADLHAITRAVMGRLVSQTLPGGTPLYPTNGWAAVIAQPGLPSSAYPRLLKDPRDLAAGIVAGGRKDSLLHAWDAVCMLLAVIRIKHAPTADALPGEFRNLVDSAFTGGKLQIGELTLPGAVRAMWNPPVGGRMGCNSLAVAVRGFSAEANEMFARAIIATAFSLAIQKGRG